MNLQRLHIDLGFFWIFITSCNLHTEEKPITATQEKTAILVLDIQNDFMTSQGKLPIQESQMKPLLKSLNELIDYSTSNWSKGPRHPRIRN